MTGMERIKDKILEDAKLKAGDILDQAEQEARAILDQASLEAAQKREELLEKAKADGEQMYRRMLAVAGLEGRKKLLGARQEMIDTAFSKAAEKIMGLPDRQYQELLEKNDLRGRGRIQRAFRTGCRHRCFAGVHRRRGHAE